MQLNHYKKPDYEEILELIKAYNYGRYIEDIDLDIELARNFLSVSINQVLLKPETFYLMHHRDNATLDGLLLFHISDWDSSHFGYPVVIIDGCYIAESDYTKQLFIANQLLSLFTCWCAEEAVRLAIVKAPSLDLPFIHACEEVKFHYIETWIFNKYNLNQFKKNINTSLGLRKAVEEDKNVMFNYSRGAFDTQRFHADHKISKNSAELLYIKWIEEAFNDCKQNILVYDENDRPVAFMIYYINDYRESLGNNYVQWKMALLDPTLRGKGLGKKFFQALLHYHSEEGNDVVDSGLSMRNLASLNLHNRIGFKLTSTLVTLHKWFS